MAAEKLISGKVTYQNISTGFWGIIGDNGEQWLPVNLPASQQKEGQFVRLNVREIDGENMFMWGTMVEIV